MRGLFEHNMWAVKVGYRLVGGKHMGKRWTGRDYYFFVIFEIDGGCNKVVIVKNNNIIIIIINHLFVSMF